MFLKCWFKGKYPCLNITQILSELCLSLGEREKQNLATAPGKLWLRGRGTNTLPGQDVKTTLSKGCHGRNHHLWALVAASDTGWGRKEKSMFLKKHGY